MIVGDPKGVADAGVEVWGADLVFSDSGSSSVRLTVDVAAFGATACHDAGEGFREVISAALRGKFWCATKFCGKDDEGAVE